MLKSLEKIARETLFLLQEHEWTNGIALPADYRFQELSADNPLQFALEKSRTSHERVILIVPENAFVERVRELKRLMAENPGIRAGFIVVSSHPESFLAEKTGFVELLEVVAEDDAKGSLKFHLLRALRQLLRVEFEAHQQADQQTLERLNEIFISLSAERDPAKLLLTVLQKAIELTGAQAGQLYRVEEKDGEMFFLGRIVQTGTQLDVYDATNKVLENNLCGYVALTGKLLNVRRIADLRPMTLPQYQNHTDIALGQPAESVLTLPLKSTQNEITGVLQIANKISADNQGVVVFEKEDESILSSLATQAAICLENTGLYQDIQNLFEGFIKASITAIESRDPSTGGHSERVAELCVALGRATTDCQVGIYRSVRFTETEMRELKYAALLHDFGKIGVREEVLVKAKKLYPYQLESIRERIKICKAAVRIAQLEKQLKIGQRQDQWEKEYVQKLEEIDRFWQIILEANEPSVLNQNERRALERIRNQQLLLPDGSEIALLTDEEYSALCITRGSLTENERLEIESHVRHTYQFLKTIPWTRDFKHLTEIAYAHHEKLDGTGYPRGLTSHEIPLQSKIMTIADIFDALTAADRWYKEAVPLQRAIDILGEEVALGKVDPVLFELFKAQRIYEVSIRNLRRTG
jgi:HD-GYP domain-containing protein (c-di-GMP phosphodiesterase class II)